MYMLLLPSVYLIFNRLITDAHKRTSLYLDKHAVWVNCIVDDEYHNIDLHRSTGTIVETTCL